MELALSHERPQNVSLCHTIEVIGKRLLLPSLPASLVKHTRLHDIPGASDTSCCARGNAFSRQSPLRLTQELTETRVVEKNITSALILEDDADWDIRIKSQMYDFAKASRLLVQPLHGTTDQFLDPSYPRATKNQTPEQFSVDDERTAKPTTSPYGDLNRWV